MVTLLARGQAMKTYGVLLLLLIHSRLFVSKSSAATTARSFYNQNDKQALLAFKRNLDNASPVLSLWNESLPYCKWEGVYCCHRHAQRVCALELPSSNLVGPISPYIGNLSYLRSIDLGDNKLYGIIPLPIGHLRLLQNLNLYNNSLSGTFPANLDNCSQLVNLSLGGNQFYGKLPSWLGHFRKLTILNLEINNFTGDIPLSITNLSFLQEVYLGHNNLLGSIPSDLGHTSQLQTISLGANNFSGFIPESIFNLTYLSKLGLEFNKFHGRLPRDMGTRLLELQILLLAENELTGEIPATLSNASFIQGLDIGFNKFSGTIPVELGKLCPQFFEIYETNIEAKVAADWNFLYFLTNCSSLVELDLSDNKLGGLFPSAIANFTSQLQLLNLENNDIIGEIPSGIENLVGVSALALDGNHLAGVIPIGIGKLQNLQELYMARNNLSGPIPFSIANLTKLSLLSAESNQLIGSIPSNIGNLTQLADLSLSDNALTGMIPRTMFNIKTLSIELALSYNFLSGTIPKEIGMLVNLERLYLSRNNLSGELPEELGSCQVLAMLALDGNSFEGTIPSFISKLKGLEFLNLSSNNFSGAIPEELGLLTGLQELYLAQNNLSGHIPLVIENLTHLFKLDISYNNIDGSVPEQGVFSNASGLMLVGNNRLCGGIPELHLPKCIIQRNNKKHSQLLLKLVIPIVSIVFLVAFISLTLLIPKWKRALTRNFRKTSLLKDRLPKVSYGELAEATGSFSTSNLIGAGTYSRVYKGNLLLNDEGNSNKEVHTVAIKVFHLQQLGSSKSFLAECKALRLVRHRNLIRIRTCCSTIDYNGNDFKALVFDYVPNGNLHSWLHPGINNGPLNHLSLTQRLNITIDVADALDYLHHNCQPSVIHCDLKPSNILLSTDFSACVGDFGLSKLLPDPISKSLVESQSSVGIRGSIGYIPPEYGEGGPVSMAGDVYSFGVLVLEMFTGRNPTEYMFKDGLTLHNFVEMAYPVQVMDIVDPNLIITDVMESTAFNKMCECLVSIIRVGLTCSKQSPVERISMQDAAIQLHKIKDIYFANRNH